MNRAQLSKIISNAMKHHKPLQLSQVAYMAEEIDRHGDYHCTDLDNKGRQIRYQVTSGRKLKLYFLEAPVTTKAVTAISNASSHDYNIVKVSLDRIIRLLEHVDYGDMLRDKFQAPLHKNIARINSALDDVEPQQKSNVIYLSKLLKGLQSPYIPIYKLYKVPEHPDDEHFVDVFDYVDDFKDDGRKPQRKILVNMGAKMDDTRK